MDMLEGPPARINSEATEAGSLGPNIRAPADNDLSGMKDDTIKHTAGAAYASHITTSN